jgi:hypothetical protein
MSRVTKAELTAQLVVARAQLAAANKDLVTAAERLTEEQCRAAPTLPLAPHALFKVPSEPGSVWCLLDLELSLDYRPHLQRYLNIRMTAKDVTP